MARMHLRSITAIKRDLAEAVSIAADTLCAYNAAAHDGRYDAAEFMTEEYQYQMDDVRALEAELAAAKAANAPRQNGPVVVIRAARTAP